MKSAEQIDRIMDAIPEGWRTRWCGGERGDCACAGCVQIGNRAVMAEKITGSKYQGDPEQISEGKLQEHPEIYAEHKISLVEWESWVSRHATQSRAPRIGDK